MNNTNPNPYAFPGHGKEGDGCKSPECGMSLRDYFAAKAMAALLLNYENSGLERDQVAAPSYQVADYMLAERNKAQ